MKRLHDVAVRMRPRVPRTPDGAPGATESRDVEKVERAAAPDAAGFSKPVDGQRIPARSPFMPTSRDLARDEHDMDDLDLGSEAYDAHAATPSQPQRSFEDLDGPSSDADVSRSAPAAAQAAPPSGVSKRPISVPRRQIWDLEPDEVEAVASHSVVTDRTYLPERDAPVEDADDVDADAADIDADGVGADDMASRALKALEKAERQLEARGIPASALYQGEGAKTRVLGFHAPNIETDAISAVARKSVGDVRFPAGWIVVVDGPGRGAYFAVTNSVSSIGRGLDQSICLNFGDASISRNNHAAIAYDAEQNRFFLGHGNKSNIVRRNGQPVLSTEELMDGDEIRIGKTTLRFVALCGPSFTWGPEPEEDAAHDD
jgi:hypothetical protein